MFDASFNVCVSFLFQFDFAKIQIYLDSSRYLRVGNPRPSTSEGLDQVQILPRMLLTCIKMFIQCCFDVLHCCIGGLQCCFDVLNCFF